MKNSELTWIELLSKIIVEKDISVNIAFLTSKERSLMFEDYLKNPTCLDGWNGKLKIYYDPSEV
jgi:hypothetical protein